METINFINQNTTVAYKTIKVDALDIFYREAGPVDAPIILLLHGWPSSSHMFRDLISDLSSKYHLIAPDYPGFGLSSTPSASEFDYTFDHLAEIMERFIDKINIVKFNLYIQDYGGPIGYRIASKRPELIESLIIQNANAYIDGFGPEVQKIGKLEQAGDLEGLKNAVECMISLDGIKRQYLHGAENPEGVSPDSYLSDHFFMERAGVKDLQVKLFQNYNTNFPLYESWQNYLRTHQPPTLIVWGKNDEIFTASGAKAYLRDLPDAELHLLNGGHFVLEEHHLKVAELIDQFLSKNLSQI
jgi:pimeloyl-ACP methyl ester carboxylesterase